MLRIAHISDLHICNSRLQARIEELGRVATEELGLPVSIGIASRASQEALRRLVDRLNPDVICITGDITTFGDKPSFEDAATYIKELSRRNGGTGDRIVVVTPGNHDVLCSQLADILDIRHLWARALRMTKLRRTTRAIKDLLRDSQVRAHGDKLANFRFFLEASRALCTATKLGDIADKPVWCVPFDSVSTNPTLMNLGATSQDSFNRFYGELRRRGEADSVLIALVHHNPVSSPTADETPILHAYNSMPGASVLVNEMQLAGTDIILFGHQHKAVSCVMDFLAEGRSHVHLLGAASATCGEPGINVIDIKDRFYASYFTVTFNRAGGFKLPGDSEHQGMVFDIERPYDTLTMCTKSEIRHFRYRDEAGEEDQWTQMHRPGVKELRIIGPRLNRLIVADRRQEIIRILKHEQNESVKILLGDPDLFERVKHLPDEDKDYLSAMWGDDITWEEQASKASLVLKGIQDLRKELPEEIRRKLEVRVAHTLLPIGAVARDLDSADGTMLIRLLPVGRMGAIERPIIRLTRRHPEAVFRFYQDYVEGLWEKARIPQGF